MCIGRLRQKERKIKKTEKEKENNIKEQIMLDTDDPYLKIKSSSRNYRDKKVIPFKSNGLSSGGGGGGGTLIFFFIRRLGPCIYR